MHRRGHLCTYNCFTATALSLKHQHTPDQQFSRLAGRAKGDGDEVKTRRRGKNKEMHFVSMMSIYVRFLSVAPPVHLTKRQRARTSEKQRYSSTAFAYMMNIRRLVTSDILYISRIFTSSFSSSASSPLLPLSPMHRRAAPGHVAASSQPLPPLMTTMTTTTMTTMTTTMTTMTTTMTTMTTRMMMLQATTLRMKVTLTKVSTAIVCHLASVTGVPNPTSRPSRLPMTPKWVWSPVTRGAATN
jgi:hypothetical protein